MYSFKQQKLIPYKAELIRDIIMDIEKYPEFLPWCHSAEILPSGEPPCLRAKLEIRFKMFLESYISKISLASDNNKYIIKSDSVSGIFEHLNSMWIITNNNNFSIVDFFIDFKLKSPILNAVIGVFFSSVTEKMIEAFENRAKIISRQ